MMEFLLQFLQEGYWIIVILVAIICEVVKNNVVGLKNFIPIVAVVLGIIFAIAHGGLILKTGFDPVAILTNVEQGIIAGAISTLGFDVLKGIMKATTNKSI